MSRSSPSAAPTPAPVLPPVTVLVDTESFLARERELVEQLHQVRYMNSVLATNLDKGIATLVREVTHTRAHRRRGARQAMP